MLRATVDRKELSTSTEMEGEPAEEKMKRQATGKGKRQDTVEVH